MELRHLRYFVAVAEELHFGRAAAKLHIAQPSLSQQIRALEEELGFPLITRTNRRVQLTAAGSIFLAEARHILAYADQAVRLAQRAHRGEVGRLALGFVGSASYSILPTIVRAFRERYPDVELLLHQLTTTEQVEALHRRHIQLGLLRLPLADPELNLEPVFREPLVVALPAAHPLGNSECLSFQQLAGEPFILYPRRLGPGTYDQILRRCAEAGFSPQIVQEAVEMQTIVGLVAAGIGISLVPASIMSFTVPGIAYRALQDSPLEWELALAWRRDEQAPVVRAFLDTARAILV